MPVRRRLVLAITVFALLGVGALAAYWFQTDRSTPAPVAAGVTLNVTQGGDRGPGSLREALFIAAASDTKATVSIKVPRIVLASVLPPLVNTHGTSILAPAGGTEIDAHGLASGAVFDVSGANASIQGIKIRNGPGAAILLRGARFRLEGATIEGFDVGVDIAENASGFLIERNRFSGNRIGVRFAGSNRDAAVVKNDFSGHKDAAIWAVRSTPDLRDPPISVRDNRFNGEPLGVLAGNIAILIERNEIRDSRNAAVQLIGEGAVVRGNRISGGGAMGIVAEGARAAIVEGNEIDHLKAYGIMVKGSSKTLLRANRLLNCGYGLAFVLGDAASPSTAVDNTIIEPYYNGIDIIGDSPILRSNHVLRPRVKALNVMDFTDPAGTTIRAKPFLDNNKFGSGATSAIAGTPRPASSGTPR